MGIAVRILIAAGIAVLAALAGFMAGRANRPDAEQQRRIGIIRAITAQTGPGQLLVIGDSVVEIQSLPPLCGRQSINAGVSGALSRDLTGFAGVAIATARPSRVVFASGINNLRLDPAFTLDDWTDEVTALVQQWRGAPIIVGITETPGATLSRSREMNSVLSKLAQSRHGVFVAPLTPAETYDGVHPSIAGATAWRSRVEAGCRALDDQQQKPRTVTPP